MAGRTSPDKPGSPTPTTARPGKMSPDSLAALTRSNRYTSMVPASDLQTWSNTFKMFDRDGGGDVDHNELGLMFRQLGFTPSDEVMRALTEEVDEDGSGSIDFEEFCLLMLRLRRAQRCPEWLNDLFCPPDEDEVDEHGKPLVAVETAVLSRPHKRGPLPGEAGPHPPLTSEQLYMVGDLLPQSPSLKSLKLAGYGELVGPFLAEEIARGIGRSNRTLTALSLACDKIGDVGAEALAAALAPGRNETLTSLDLAGNEIGEIGAVALLGALKAAISPPISPPAAEKAAADAKPKSSEKRRPPAGAPAAAPAPAPAPAAAPTAADASAASEAAAPAAVEAKTRKQEPQRLGCRLRVLRLEDNPAIPHDLRTEIAQALLQLNLPSILHSQVGSSGGGGGGERRSAAKAPPPLAQAAAWKPGGLAADATVPQATPHATVSDIALAAPHAPTLLAEAAARSLGGIALVDCGGFGDAGAAALLPLPPQPQQGTPDAASPSMALSSIVSLRLSACRLTNASVHVLGEFISLGCVPALASLRLDANRLTLNEPPPAGIAYDGQVTAWERLSESFAESLGCLRHLSEIDISANPVRDVAAAAFCRLCCSFPRLQQLHLAGTHAGDATATACAQALSGEGRTKSVLRSLAISGGVGDVGAARLADAISCPGGCKLHELWIGPNVTDSGAESLASALGAPGCALRILGLGGMVRGGIGITNQLGARAAEVLADAATIDGSPLETLRLSGNGGIGGAACVAMMAALHRSDTLRCLHIDGCGLAKPDAAKLLETLQASVWCLHELRVDYDVGGAASVASLKAAASASASTLASGAHASPSKDSGRLLSLQQKLALVRTLEDNRAMGRRRVESWMLSKSLDEVAWVFNTLCANIDPSVVEAGLDAWQGGECAQFVRNCGLPQYDLCFASNLSGAKLQALQICHLAQLGVGTFAHQKEVMKCVRLLLHAYSRKESAANAMGQWDLALGRKLAKKEKRRQQQKREAKEAARLRAAGAAARRAERERQRREGANRAHSSRYAGGLSPPGSPGSKPGSRSSSPDLMFGGVPPPHFPPPPPRPPMTADGRLSPDRPTVRGSVTTMATAAPPQVVMAPPLHYPPQQRPRQQQQQRLEPIPQRRPLGFTEAGGFSGASPPIPAEVSQLPPPPAAPSGLLPALAPIGATDAAMRVSLSAGGFGGGGGIRPPRRDWVSFLMTGTVDIGGQLLPPPFAHP